MTYLHKILLFHIIFAYSLLYILPAGITLQYLPTTTYRPVSLIDDYYYKISNTYATFSYSIMLEALHADSSYYA